MSKFRLLHTFQDLLDVRIMEYLCSYDVKLGNRCEILLNVSFKIKHEPESYAKILDHDFSNSVTMHEVFNQLCGLIWVTWMPLDTR